MNEIECRGNRDLRTLFLDLSSTQATRRLFLTGVLMLPLSNARATNHERIFRWDEEFVLDTGEKLLLERSLRFRRSGEPYNPMIIGWAQEDSTIVVREGPTDLVGARYTLKNWIDPVMLERDPTTRELVMVGTAWNCDLAERFGDQRRGLYIAFRMRADAEAEAMDFPNWAWGKQRKLYKIFVEIPPPARVTPAEAVRHNKTDARGAKRFFLIDPSHKPSGC